MQEAQQFEYRYGGGGSLVSELVFILYTIVMLLSVKGYMYMSTLSV